MELGKDKTWGIIEDFSKMFYRSFFSVSAIGVTQFQLSLGPWNLPFGFLIPRKEKWSTDSLLKCFYLNSTVFDQVDIVS